MGGLLGPDGQPIDPQLTRKADADESGHGGHAGHEHCGHDHDHDHEHGGHEHGEQRLPEPSLALHVFHLASQVGMALGETENPFTGQREKDLPTARFLIDTIAMLEEKTRGNRSPDEEEYLRGVLSNLRMAFVARSK
ncbi:MAG: DUF1844 domain-containing protein [Planctomycetota bacterium]